MEQRKTADGRFSVEALIVNFEKGHVWLQRKDNGKQIEVPIEKFCEADREVAFDFVLEADPNGQEHSALLDISKAYMAIPLEDGTLAVKLVRVEVDSGEINHALGRISDGLYGLCMGLGEPIGIPRLRAKPWAKYCIDYARKIEQGLIPHPMDDYGQSDDDDDFDDD